MAEPPLNKHGFKEPRTITQQKHTTHGSASYRPAAYRPKDNDYTMMSPLQCVACTGHFDIFADDWAGETPRTERAEQQVREAATIIEARLEALRYQGGDDHGSSMDNGS